jgi:hypothetical protein
MEVSYPTIEEALARGWFIDAASDDIDFSTPDGKGFVALQYAIRRRKQEPIKTGADFTMKRA